jgi:protease IV
MTRWTLSTATFVVLSLFAAVATAQQITPSDGLQVPDASIATVGDALSLEVNPAGLGFMSRPELGYGFQLASEDLRGVAEEAQSYFLAAGTGWLGAGVGAQWLQKPDLGGELQSYRKFTLGTGFSVSRLGFGMGLNFFGSSDNERLDGLLGLDLGMQFRASRLLGAGVMVRDANGPFFRENQSLPTRIEGSIALRFFDGRLVFEQAAQTNFRDRYARLVPRLSVEPLQGFRMFGRTEFQLTRVGDVFDWSWQAVFAGIELSLGSIGALYAATTRQYPPNERQQFAGISSYHWISPGKRAPLIPLTKRWVYVNLDRTISEEPTRELFQPRARSFLSIARELERIAESSDVAGVVIATGGDLGFAQLWELRELIKQARDAGKKTVAVLPSSSLRAYYLASAAEQIWYAPTDVVSPMGLRSSFMSVREAFAKLGVEAQFVRIGDYKSTPEMFVVDEPTDANLEQRNAYLDAYWEQIVGDIASSRNKSADDVKALLSQTHLPDEALERKVVDRVVYADEIEKILREEESATLERGYAEPRYTDEEWRGGPQIAVVAIDGNIVQGRSGNTPFIGGAFAGSKSLAATFERLRQDASVRAVVVRIDSPGGSAVASDLIYRSIRRLAASKPVVASMGNIAASGGYYVAAGANEIVAAPTTLTGSIGIFAGKINVAQLADRIGVNTATIERGTPSSFSDIFNPWSEAEIDNVGKSLNYMYRLFLTQVAHTRPLTLDELDAVARGRVWAGRAARDAKLVDHNGGILHAIHRAEDLAGLRRGVADYRQYAVGSRLGMDIDVQSKIGKLLGFDEAGSARNILTGRNMVARFVRETAFAWSLALLYDAEEALMLPSHDLRLRD